MEFSTNFWWDLLDVAIFSSIGIILMLLGNFLIDLIIPCSFPEEIKKRNKSVGFVSAGINIGVGLLLRAAISNPQGTTIVVKETILSGLLYFAIGIVFFMLGYIVVRIFNRQYNINDEIGNGNTAAGIMVAGIFIGLALVISGVIM